MACNLTEDLTGAFDMVGPKGSTSTLFVENDAGTAVIETARFNNADVPPDANHKVTITEKAQAGINFLDITVNGVQDTDRVRLKEDCGDSNSRLLKTFQGSEPAQRFQINAT
jgi:hypothetical protein